MGTNFTSNVMQLGYLSSMGWKPFLAIRNSVADFNMLAPRFGLDWVIRARKEILDDPKAVFERLRGKGILSEKPPIINALVGGESTLGRFNQAAFAWFKNSDDLTRAVAYLVGERRLENAINARKLNQSMSKDDFFKMSGLSRISENDSSQITALLDAGKEESAQDLFGSIVARQTMFDYSGAASPALYRGLIGKAFGQYGTFSAGYRANLAAMVKYGSPAEITESIVTYLAISGLLWYGFESIKVKTNDFIPLMPGIFTGGPAFDTALNLIKSTDLGFEGQQARAAVARDLPMFVPGTAQAKPSNALSTTQKVATSGL
ncbi:MAG: hypothetical protein HC888_02670 [Candidatus Competibacteraceae bacterium]|nr:hypothetical protein [Candidatus Competibacteraceae bacterium]